MFNFAQIRLKKENIVRRVIECAMIYMLTAILVLVEAAAGAVVVILPCEMRACRLGADGASDNGQVNASSSDIRPWARDVAHWAPSLSSLLNNSQV